MKKLLFLLSFSARIFIFLLILLISYSSLDLFFETENVYRARDFKALKSDSIDIAFIGSSHVEYSIYAPLIHNYSSYSSFNLASACQPLDVSLLMIDELFKTQKPSVIAYEVYSLMENNCASDQSYTLASFMLRDKEREKVLDFVPNEKYQYLNSFLNNHNDWKTLTYEDLKRKGKAFLNFFNKQSYLNDTSFNHVFQLPVERYNYFLPEDISAGKINEDLLLHKLNTIKEKVKSMGSELLLFYVPMVSSDKGVASLEYINKYASSNNIPFIDFTKPIDRVNYYLQVHGDTHHTNDVGAPYINYFISEFIKENFPNLKTKDHDLKDHYERDAKYFLFNRYIKNELDPLIYLRTMKNFGDYKMIYYNFNNEADNDYLDYVLKPLINDMGFNFNPNDKFYFALINNNQLIFETKEESKFKLNDKLLKITNNGIYLDDNRIDYSKNKFQDYKIESVNAGLSFIFSDQELNNIVAKNIDSYFRNELGWHKYLPTNYKNKFNR